MADQAPLECGPVSAGVRHPPLLRRPRSARASTRRSSSRSKSPTTGQRARRTITSRCCSVRSVTRRIEAFVAPSACHATLHDEHRPNARSLDPRSLSPSSPAFGGPTSRQPRLSRRNRRSAAGPQRLRRCASIQGRLGREDRSGRVGRARGVRAGRRDVCCGARPAAGRAPGWPRPFAAAWSTSCTREPVEDFRIDFEDGYGIRPDAEEDGHARIGRRGGGRRSGGWHASAVHRHPDQADVERTARAQPADARSVRDDARRARRADGCRRTSSSRFRS